MNSDFKKVSVLIPCRNEVRAIEHCLQSVFSFEPPAEEFEVIVIDGNSDDGTRDVLRRLRKQYQELIVVDNPYRTVPHATNLGIRVAKGEYIVRADARCIHPKSYLSDLLILSGETGADNVGGVLVPVGYGYIQKGIAAAYKSSLSMGNALRERDDFYGETDTVYGGCLKKRRLIEIGMYDESMVRNQDDELSFRLRKHGGTIIQSSKIKIKYYPRDNMKDLFKQFSQYGFWKVSVIKKHPHQASPRHFAPMALLISLSVLGFASIVNSYALWGFFLLLGSYLAIVAGESVRVAKNTEKKFFPVIFSAIITIHFGFGIGFIAGIFSQFLNTKPKWFEALSR